MISPEEGSIVLSKTLVCVLNAADILFVEGICSIWMSKSCAKSYHGTGVAALTAGWDGSSCDNAGMGSRWDGSGGLSVMWE